MAGDNFDTLAAADALIEADIEEKQARAIVALIFQAITENAATKEDVLKALLQLMFALFATMGLSIGVLSILID